MDAERTQAETVAGIIESAVAWWQLAAACPEVGTWTAGSPSGAGGFPARPVEPTLR